MHSGRFLGKRLLQRTAPIQLPTKFLRFSHRAEPRAAALALVLEFGASSAGERKGTNSTQVQHRYPSRTYRTEQPGAPPAIPATIPDYLDRLLFPLPALSRHAQAVNQPHLIFGNDSYPQRATSTVVRPPEGEKGRIRGQKFATLPAPHINIESVLNQVKGRDLVTVIAQSRHTTTRIGIGFPLAYEIGGHVLSLSELIQKTKSSL